MSKFFKWLKKDKQQSEPEANNEEALQIDSSPEILEEELEKINSDNEKEVLPEVQPAAEGSSVAEVDAKKSQQESLGLVNELDEPIVTDDREPLHIEGELAPALEPEPIIIEESAPLSEPEPEETNEKQSFFSRLRKGLSRTKESIGSGIVSLFKGKAIDDELFEELETQLLMADVGMNTTVKIIKQLTESSNRNQLKDGDALYKVMKTQMAEILDGVDAPLTLSAPSGPFVILMVGVNGVGKTTTIGKMAKQFQQQGKKVMLAAGDTFRAAAVEQLQVWGERNDIPVVAQQTGSDSASVIFDAFQSAKAKNIDVLIADTAGRLQNKDHLMEELKKVVRVMKKISPEAPHEIMLTLDASTGQNAISQTKLFHEAVGLNGITLTKLDGTAKGGVIFAIADQFDIPIRYIGVGEGIDDLRPFNSKDFVNALFAESEDQPK
ncbi:signal recognition particle-docking protein FtsY [Paraglaciecola marina]|uniref:signal recognition particle-docking protein FtsY n=1 Tax=Paraglaciecola marina TaxID=2500157 RepID=UPI00105D7CAA|nr:signal recognition particle-docking protein FtsY [Paraglaciecola marina]